MARSRDNRGILLHQVASMPSEHPTSQPSLDACDFGRLVAMLGGATSSDADRLQSSHYRLLLDNAGFPISYVSGEGIFLFIGRRGAMNLGLPPEQIIGRTIYEFFPQADADEYLGRIRRVMGTGREATFEDLVQLPDGPRWFWSIMHPLRNADGLTFGVQIVSHDVTQRKASEAELEERLRFEQLITDVASNFVNSSATDIDDVIQRALQAITIYLQADRGLLFQFSDDMSELNCTHEWHQAAVAAALPRLRRQSATKYLWLLNQFLAGKVVVLPDIAQLPVEAEAERSLLTEHGVLSMLAMPIQVSGRTAGTLCFDCLRAKRDWSSAVVLRLRLVGQMLVTVLARIRAERALSESREFIKGITESLPHMVYVLDTLNLQVTYVGPQVQDELGYSPQEILELGAAIAPRLMHPEDLARLPLLTARWEARPDDKIAETELRLQHADGRWRWYLLRDKVLRRDAQGRITVLIGTARDITAAKEAAEEEQRHRNQLVHVARLSTMGEMVAGIAHEIGQPLYSILNFAKASSNVLEKHASGELLEVAEWVDQIALSATRAGEIIRRLRDFARRSEPQRATLDVAAVVQDAAALMAFEMRRRSVDLQLKLPAASLWVRADRVQLLQVIVNLLQNAIEAVADGPPEERIVKISGRVSQGQVTIAVSDRGVGLPAESLAIFDAFVTTKPDGLGLGLAISKTLLEAHGGELWTESNLGRGATFYFTLPVQKEGELHVD